MGFPSFYRTRREAPYNLGASSYASLPIPFRCLRCTAPFRLLPSGFRLWPEIFTTTWNALVESGGWTTGACESMNFKASYALFCVYFPRNGVRCTATCGGVAKSARCRSMRLCHRSWPKNRPNAFAFFGMGDLMMASIFPGSTAMHSSLTMSPRRVPLVTSNAHLARFRLSLAA